MINATLIVQVVHFYVAYLLFRYILLNTGYQVLNEEKEHQHSLEEKVAQAKRIIEHERQKKQDAWSSFRAWCGEYIPSVVDRILLVRGVSISLAPEEITDEQKKEARNQLVKSMVSSLKDRYDR